MNAIYIAILVILIGVLILCAIRPKKTIVSVEAPSEVKVVETYRQYAEPTISVRGVRLTLPTSYGKYIFSDGSQEDAELRRLGVTLKAGPTVLNTVTVDKPQQLPTDNFFTTSEALRTNWYMSATGAGETVEIVIEDRETQYTSGDLRVEVQLSNSPDGMTVVMQPAIGVDISRPPRDILGVGKEDAITAPELAEGELFLKGLSYSPCETDNECLLQDELCLKSDIAEVKHSGRCLTKAACRYAADIDGTAAEVRCSSSIANIGS